MGCLIELFTMPFKMIYYFFKTIHEILEFFEHRSHRKHSSTNKSSKSSSFMTSNKKKSHFTEIPDDLSKSIEDCVSMGRDINLSFENRINVYNLAFKGIDMVNKMISNQERKDLLILRNTLENEQRELLRKQ